MAKEATKEQVERWKKEHGSIYQIEVEDDSKGLERKVAYLRKPKRHEMSAAMKRSKDDGIKMAEIILKHIFLGGDEEIKNNDDYFFAAVNQLDPVLEAANATIKKL